MDGKQETKGRRTANGKRRRQMSEALSDGVLECQARTNGPVTVTGSCPAGRGGDSGAAIGDAKLFWRR